MIKFEVIDKKDFDTYILKNIESGREHSIMFVFYGGVRLDIGDEISLPIELTNRNYEGYAQPYCYEVTTKKLEELIDVVQRKDFAIIKSNNKTIFLKRIYG